MRTFTKAAVGAGVALSMMIGVAQAASLTNDQVSAILNLIRSFGADQSVIDNVQASLTGSTPSISNNQQGENEDTNRNEDNNQGNDHRGPNMMGSTTPWMNGQSQGDRGQHQGPGTCLTFTHNIEQGDQGDDVKSLQELLKDEGEFDGAPTGFFGPITARALAMWQEHQGIASSTQGGVVGPMTRGFLERRCGAGQGDNGRGNGGLPGQGGMMGSTTNNAPMMPVRPPQQ